MGRHIRRPVLQRQRGHTGHHALGDSGGALDIRVEQDDDQLLAAMACHQIGGALGGLLPARATACKRSITGLGGHSCRCSA